MLLNKFNKNNVYLLITDPNDFIDDKHSYILYLILMICVKSGCFYDGQRNKHFFFQTGSLVYENRKDEKKKKIMSIQNDIVTTLLQMFID